MDPPAPSPGPSPGPAPSPFVPYLPWNLNFSNALVLVVLAGLLQALYHGVRLALAHDRKRASKKLRGLMETVQYGHAAEGPSDVPAVHPLPHSLPPLREQGGAASTSPAVQGQPRLSRYASFNQGPMPPPRDEESLLSLAGLTWFEKGVSSR